MGGAGQRATAPSDATSNRDGPAPPPPAYIRIPLIQASALVAEVATFPIDLVKTRMQVDPARPGFMATLRTTLAGNPGAQTSAGAAGAAGVQRGGIAALYRGVQPAVVRHWIYTATRVILYEDIRNALARYADPQGRGDGAAPLWCMMAAGFSAGAIGQFIASPADLVKVRLQTSTPGRYTGALHAVRTIRAEEGLKGFYKGWKPNVTRAALVNLGELATYDQAKRTVLETTGFGDGVVTHTLSALLSGFFAALFSTPADVCKSNVMSGAYPTMTSCLVGTVKTKGVAALWTGFMPNWLRLGPWQFCFWLSYENLRIQTTGQGF